MEKIHDLSFCPSCGSKLNGDETICPFCGYRLLEAEKQFGIRPTEIPEPNMETPQASVEPPDETVNAVTTPPEPVVVNAIHKMAFCPECGAKLDGTEVVCPMCGFRLTEPVEQQAEPLPVEPVVMVTPDPEPEMIKAEDAAIKEVAPPITKQEIKAPVAEVPRRKKRSGLIVLLLILIVIFAGAAVVSYLQYAGNVNIPFLSKIIPSNKPVVIAPVLEKNYYFCYAPNHTMKDQIIIISSVFTQDESGNSKVTAANAFKKLVNLQYPKDCFYFSNVIATRFSDFEEAMNFREKTKRDYEKRKYDIRYIEIH